ncbi:uncharacterized protein N7496_000758 [Penicillium cataractarum]|uniref:F-box domain-containing protein n=1 Tax=Penicillium cataractarum TaxID=2100454 RepID=A0A9X0B6A4_9EURO|nr:uncharacterized protein N7496_000758 [Penicillium cataractarum]KAJ5389690.1 hypothetical protein N7496_000758 [Penicillium cataractarum]
MAETTESETTRVMTTPVLTTPEILEMILLHTDMRTLLTSAQRVCRDWLNLIAKSPSIQKALFFTPIKDSEWGTKEKTINPLLAESFPPIFPPKDGSRSHKFDFSDLKWTQDPSSMTRFIRKDASWRKMLVQQPPPPELGLFNLYHARGGDTAACLTIPAYKKNKPPKIKGLRMSRLFEVLLFSHQVQFSIGTIARVYWSTEEPFEFNGSYDNINAEFHRMLGQIGVVLYTRKVMQCTIGLERPVSKAERTRMEIIKAYREGGFDVDGIKEEIEASKSPMVRERGSRNGKREREWEGTPAIVEGILRR